MIHRFTGKPQSTIRHLNELVNAINRLENIVGDGIVRVRKGSFGLTIGVDRERIRQIVTKSSASTGIVRVECAEDAPSGTVIKCWQLDSDGIAVDGSGEVGIDVNCDIFGGSSLASAVPRLSDGDEIPVYRFNGDYYCAFWFHDSCQQDCEGSV